MFASKTHTAPSVFIFVRQCQVIVDVLENCHVDPSYPIDISFTYIYIANEYLFWGQIKLTHNHSRTNTRTHARSYTNIETKKKNINSLFKTKIDRTECT